MPFPWPLIAIPAGDWDDSLERQAIEMAAAHNAFIRSLNAIHAQADTIRDDQAKDFAFFCVSFCEMLHHHHDIEESMVFPFFETKLGAGAMSDNVSQHRAFDASFSSFQSWFQEVYDGKATYSAPVALEKVDALGDVLVSHLAAEIPTIHADKLRAAGFKAQDFKDLEKRMMSVILKDISFFTSMPMGILSHDRESLPEFPPLPKPLLWAVRYGFSWKFAKSWEFAPCDWEGKVKAGLGNVPLGSRVAA
ncbi:hypothetical protein FB45DRAFT_9174 [Roridomyces roridus]|uniref:Hemerythrin-like domain-containing protein n=1 Tax=Roridomyces roridus TaxID=1738132 RepID=A0AAD7CIQ5_9AGAR|nr:hypothetical protein FB45DRAFT_9174 [Roridomyces roridus]